MYFGRIKMGNTHCWDYKNDLMPWNWMRCFWYIYKYNRIFVVLISLVKVFSFFFHRNAYKFCYIVKYLHTMMQMQKYCVVFLSSLKLLVFDQIRIVKFKDTHHITTLFLTGKCPRLDQWIFCFYFFQVFKHNSMVVIYH